MANKRVDEAPPASGGAPSSTPLDRSEAGRPPNFEIRWSEPGMEWLTTKMLHFIRDDKHVRQTLYVKTGEASTKSTKMDAYKSIMANVFPGVEKYEAMVAREPGRGALAIKARILALEAKYDQKKALLTQTGGGLTGADVLLNPTFDHIHDKIRAEFPWFDIMDELCAERRAVGVRCLQNSADPIDLSSVYKDGKIVPGAARKRKKTSDELKAAEHALDQVDADLADDPDTDPEPQENDEPGSVHHPRNHERVNNHAAAANAKYAPFGDAIRDGQAKVEARKAVRDKLDRDLKLDLMNRKMALEEKKLMVNKELEEKRIQAELMRAEAELKRSEAESISAQARLLEAQAQASRQAEAAHREAPGASQPRWYSGI